MVRPDMLAHPSGFGRQTIAAKVKGALTMPLAGALSRDSQARIFPKFPTISPYCA
jgi:hypothetical protein